LKRRDVIAMGLAAGCAAAKLPFSFAQTPSSPGEVSNRYFRARFDAQSGLFHARLADGSTFLVNASARALAPSWICSSADSALSRKVRSEKIQDALGSGSKLVGECRDEARRITLGVEISLYDEHNALVLELTLRNDSNSSLPLRSLEPVHAIAEETGLCTWRHTAKSITNGFLYADPGEVRDFSQTSNRPQKSVWNMGFAGDPGAPGLTIGFLENDSAIGRITAAVGSYRDVDGFSLSTEASFAPNIIIKPGQSVRSGRFVFQIAPGPFAALERYAQMVGDAHRLRPSSAINGPIINGWCNWFYDHTNTSEDEVLRNAEFAARHLKPYGLEWIQIDDGYQRGFSDWEGNEKFPHGMKWLAGKIRELGLRPGIWIAPYVVSEGTDIHRNHPEWLIRNRDGGIRHCGDRGKTKLFGLDFSVPEAAAWLRGFIHRIANEWGYDFLKIDFVEWTIFSAEKFADPTWSRATAYRKGAEILREAVGPDRHLLDCGPAQITTGLISSARIELDQPFLTWEQYTGPFNSSVAAAAKRYYFHKRTWINDADHLGVSLLTPSQAQAAASIIALSGGTMISGDRLPELDATRLDIIRKVFPSFGEAARPIDLFENEKPEIFALPVKTPFEEWMVVALFNYDEGGALEKSVALSRLGLDAAHSWLAFDFWQQRSLGTLQGELRTLVPPASVALVALRKDRGVPQVLSTDRHFTQGGIELRDVAWNAQSNTLTGLSLGGLGTHHHVLVHVPPAYALNTAPPSASAYSLGSDAPELPHDFPGYSVTLLPTGLARVALSFAAATEVSWVLPFART
jgi:alpha-galactosidase